MVHTSHQQYGYQEKEDLPYSHGIKKEQNSRGGIVGVPKRYILLLMIFSGFVNIYAMRVNLNVALVAMVNNQIVLQQGVKSVKPAEFDWSSKLQGLVLGSFFYGYWVLQVPGAWLAMKIGGTRVFGYGVLVTSLLAILTPVAARYHVMALITVRIFQGLFLGVTFPCNHAIWSKWAPPLERSSLITISIAGCPFGNIVAIPLTGVLSKYGFDGGWPSVFYCIGISGVVWYCAWELIVHDSPSSHPTISSEERDFIETSIAGSDDQTEFNALPWSDILSSSPVWAIVCGHFGACWGYYTLFTGMPTYFKDVLDFDIEQTGFLAACPYLFKAILGPLGGVTADGLIRYKICTIGTVRKVFYAAGCLLAGVFIVATGYTQHPRTSVIFLVLGVGFSGLNAIGYAVNHLDIAPPFAGILMGLTNTFASTPGFISPQITGFVTSNKNQEEWRIVFWLTLVIYAIAVFFYTLLASGDRQPWAMPRRKEVAVRKENDS
ncbi:vesicular glutamate transporter 3-like isoform X2 [Acropora palmata]